MKKLGLMSVLILTIVLLSASIVLQTVYAEDEKDLYVSDWLQDMVLRYDAITRDFRGVFVKPGGGFLHRPFDCTFGPDGNLYVSSWGSDEIRRYNANGDLVDIFIESGSGGLNMPNGIAFGPDGNLYVVSGAQKVMRYNGTTGVPLGSAGDPGDATFIPYEPQNMRSAYDLAFGPDGDIYISSWTSQVFRYGPYGNFKEIFVEAIRNAGLSNATGLAFSPLDGNLYVSSWFTDEIKVYYGPGHPNAGNPVSSGTFVSSGAGNLDKPEGIVFKSDGSLIVSSRANNKVKQYDRNGNFVIDYPAGGMNEPKGLTFGNDGYLYVCNSQNNEILKYAPPGSAFTIFTRGESIQGGLSAPGDLVFGPVDGDLYISSYISGDIKVFDKDTGKYKKTLVAAGSGGLKHPIGLSFGSDGNLYVADYGTNFVKVFDGFTGAFKKNIFMGSDCVLPKYIDHAPKLVDTDEPLGHFYVSCHGRIIKRIRGADHSVTSIIDYGGDRELYGNVQDGTVPCKLSDPHGLRWSQILINDIPARSLTVVDYNHNVVKHYWHGIYDCEPPRTDGPHITFDLKTPGLPRHENRPVDIASFYQYFVSVPQAGLIRSFDQNANEYPGIGPGRDELIMPWGLTVGPKPSALPRWRGIFGRWRYIQKLPMEARRMFEALFAEDIDSRKKDRKYWMSQLEKRYGAKSELSKGIIQLIKTMPEDNFVLLKQKMHGLSVIQKPYQPKKKK